MCRKDTRATATSFALPAPDELLGRFGARSPLAQDGVRVLFEAVASERHEEFARWKDFFSRWAGRTPDKLSRDLERPAARYGITSGLGGPAALLFALQTYYALVVENLVERFAPRADFELLSGNPFSWCKTAGDRSIGRMIVRVQEAISSCGKSDSPADGPCDLFKPLYQDLFPRPLRHRLGEYYTPDWLARHVLDQVGYTGDPAARLLDPACGSGTFLVMALRRLRTGIGDGGRGIGIGIGAAVPAAAKQCPLARQLNCRANGIPSPTSPASPFPIVGFDLNPLAVLTARANYLLAVADLLPETGRVTVPIYLRDSILDRGDGPDGGGQFDFVVGNPPWIAWDNLPAEDRRATKPLWERYGLFSLSGNQARHGGGKKDLSMLMLYAAADKYLRSGGRLGMVVTQTVFQTVGAGDGFRRFRLGQDGTPLGVLRVDDLAALRPFGNAAGRTGAIFLQKGSVTRYPVPYFKWRMERREASGERRNDECGMMKDECRAAPIDPARPSSPWLVLSANSRRLTASGSCTNKEVADRRLATPGYLFDDGKAPYTAHLGANSGGANGVYWLEVLGASDGGVVVRNLAAKGKHRLETVETTIEPDLLYPLLRWGDVARYRALPRCCILLAQDPATRAGIDEAAMRERYPRTLAYVERFRDLLAARAAYRRYQGRGPFYAMYNVGPYTVAPIKVVWRRMDRRINAAVVEASAAGTVPIFAPTKMGPSPLTSNIPTARPTAAALCRAPVPQETCVLVACRSADEAHYLCAMLNSEPIGEIVAGHCVSGGKGFGTPGMLDYLPIRRFDPARPRHAELAALSRRAHAAAGGREAPALEELQRRMDELAVAAVFSM